MLAAAVQLTVTDFAVLVVVTAVGAAGAIAAEAVIAADAADVNEVVPLPLGVTVKVYVTPFVSPLTVQDCAPVGIVTLLMTEHVPLCTAVDCRAVGTTVAVAFTVYCDATPSAVKLTLMAPLAAHATVGVARKLVPTRIDADCSD